MQYVTIWDFILFPVYFLIFYAIGNSIKGRNIEENKAYEYYVKGLLVKILGGFIFCCIYCFYYNGGDTNAYWESAGILNKMMSKNFSVYLDIMSGNLTKVNYYNFDKTTSYPDYWRDPQSFSTVRFTSPFYLLSIKSYFTCTLLVSALT